MAIRSSNTFVALKFELVPPFISSNQMLEKKKVSQNPGSPSVVKFIVLVLLSTMLRNSQSSGLLIRNYVVC